MRRGDVVVVDLAATVGSEADKRRPAVVVSNDGANLTAARTGRGVVAVVPLTASAERVFPFQVFVPAGEAGLEEDSKAQAEQIRSIAVGRVAERLGRLPIDRMFRLDEALRLHLSL